MQGVKNVMRVQPLPKGKLFTDYELMIVVLDIFSGYLLDILMTFFFKLHYSVLVFMKAIKSFTYKPKLLYSLEMSSIYLMTKKVQFFSEKINFKKFIAIQKNESPCKI